MGKNQQKKGNFEKLKLINLEVLKLVLGKLSFAPFHKCLSATFLLNLLSKPIPSASAGLNSNNCGADLIFVTAEEVLSRPFLFWLKKKKEKKLPIASLIGSTCVCFCREAVLPVFNLTPFDRLLAHFRKCIDA